MKKQSPLVSFIIPYHNAGSTIQETIDSIFNQSYSNFDVWIINDGSTDQVSIDKLKEFEGNEKIHILYQENAGPSVARNLAIKKTKAAFIVPIDADDLIAKETLSEGLKTMHSDDTIGVVYGNLQYFGAQTKIQIQEDFNPEKQLVWNQIAVCCLIRKSVFDTVGFYDTHLSKLGLEDWEFWIRVGNSQWHFVKLEHIQFSIRIQENSRTVDVANKNLETIRAYVSQKHSIIWMKHYEKKYYEVKMLHETPDYKIGKFMLAPYRFFKKTFLKNE
jgi:glycosyltransferase involved in cell wall biosynthesis